MQKHAEKHISFTEEDVQSKSHQIPYLYQSYLKILSKELKELNDIELEKLSMYGFLFEHYKFNHTYRYDTKTEIEAQIFGDSKYQSISKRYEEQHIIVIYIEKTLENIKSMSFSIKNFIELKKFYAGEF